MSISTFPASIAPHLPFKLAQKYNTLESDFDSGGSQTQRLWRFPKIYATPLSYINIPIADRDTLSDFFRACYGKHKPFWFFDFIQRHWTDLYVGQGGPLTVGGALQYTASGAVYTDYTDHANDATTNDVIILPAAGSGNGFLVGSLAPFDKIIFTISTPGAGTYTISNWKYWNGSSLGNLSGISDGTTNFKAAAGDREVTFTVPNDWVIDERKTIDMYWVWAVFDGGTVTTPPKCTKVQVNSKYYDLPSKSTVNDGTLITYVDAVATAKTFVSGGGGGGADRFYFSSYPAQGSLITADLNGKLRLKAKFANDEFPEEVELEDEIGKYFLLQLGIQQIQW